jgi:hypothetical protein
VSEIMAAVVVSVPLVFILNVLGEIRDALLQEDDDE